MAIKTVGQWLESLATTNQSTEQDSDMMSSLLRRAGFSKVVVTCGIVYLDGKGTIEAPPIDIHTIARILITRAHA